MERSESEWSLDTILSTMDLYPKLKELKSIVENDSTVEESLRKLLEDFEYSPNDLFNRLVIAVEEKEDILVLIAKIEAEAIKKPESEE